MWRVARQTLVSCVNMDQGGDREGPALEILNITRPGQGGNTAPSHVSTVHTVSGGMLGRNMEQRTYIDRQQGSRAAHHNKSVNKTRDAPAPSLPPRLLPAPVVVTRNSLFRFNISEFVSY